MIIVPDASVILKWVLEKGEGEEVMQALALQNAFIAGELELQVPTLWQYEVGNVLGLKQPELAGELMSALLEYELPEAPLTPNYCQAVLRLMQEIKGVTFYDSCYHVLAIQKMGLYLTADREYIKKASGKGHVSLLAEWQKSKR
jgi:predicted nucleic acid-binding protein